MSREGAALNAFLTATTAVGPNELRDRISQALAAADAYDMGNGIRRVKVDQEAVERIALTMVESFLEAAMQPVEEVGTRCDPKRGIHVSPHRGCILR